MALDDDIRTLSGVGLFSDLTPEQLRLLAFGAEQVRLASGREIYRENAPADCAYVIVAGKVVLYREQDGEAVALSRVGPGTLLGELALITDTRRLTYAAAETDVELIRLNRSLFRRILEEYPETAAELHRRMLEELQAFLQKIERLAPKFSD
ncbi:cyclic nucleotide-binding domain-containing protein [Aquamicrobium zhengzhouense]|uniref:Cyclic nucleotide-binding domain-containing protein n=1 Tax=Aquamicrobium zhengzhouense TaxID=2781738 RepID=A0ABS0SHP9_9HYPH|nr:cyclic nucleotide-binding domain-containing protein [Aquamicrobium zhengzhouense]MBI1622105.1 cyclic nucleotide-binding domain-containing protein [Aquamicrobium zhengzhouense]